MTGKAKLYAKLAKVMAAVERLPKEGYNEHFKYNFVTDATVADSIRKELGKQGVAFFAEITDAKQELAPTGKSIKTSIWIEFTFACGETGETVVKRWRAEALDNQDKGINKAVTSAEKYFLLKTFVMGAGDDPDESKEPATTKKTTKRKSPRKKGAKSPKEPATQPWPARPFKPEYAKRALRMKRHELGRSNEAWDTEPLPDDRHGALMGALAAVTAGDDDRHKLGWALWGKTSTNDWTAAEAEATIAWVDIAQDDDGQWVPSPLAVDEARMLVAEKQAEEPSAEEPTQSAQAQALYDVQAPDDPSFCTVHECEMKLHEKDGEQWYSHKTPNGMWCRGA